MDQLVVAGEPEGSGPPRPLLKVLVQRADALTCRALIGSAQPRASAQLCASAFNIHSPPSFIGAATSTKASSGCDPEWNQPLLLRWSKLSDDNPVGSVVVVVVVVVWQSRSSPLLLELHRMHRGCIC